MLHAADTARNRLIGIGIVSLSYVSFTLLDGSAKWLVGTMPLIMVVWLRCLMHTAFSSLLLLRHGRAMVRTRHLHWHLLRALMFMVITFMNFWCLKHLPLAVVTAIWFASPIIIAFFSTWLLSERLAFGAWTAIVVGFAGVIVILQPGTSGFHPAMLVTLLSAALNSVSMLIIRRLAAHDPPETIQYLPAIGATIGLAPFAVAGWEWPEGWLEWLVVCMLGFFGALSHYLLAAAHRYARATVLAPFMYQQVIYAAVAGYLVFGDVPGATMWLGAAIVIASGLYLYHRERSTS